MDINDELWKAEKSTNLREQRGIMQWLYERNAVMDFFQHDRLMKLTDTYREKIASLKGFREEAS